MIKVERTSEDGLSACVWEFSIYADMGDGLYLNLTRYAEGTRKTRRHKLVGEQWESRDERFYHSKLPRPTSIPDDVIAEAMQQLKVNVSIGWVRPEYVIATRKVA